MCTMAFGGEMGKGEIYMSLFYLRNFVVSLSASDGEHIADGKKEIEIVYW